MTLWLILVFSTVFSVATLYGAAVNERAIMASRREMAADPRGRYVMGCIAPLGAVVMMALWLVYSFEVRDWRFGAIAILPGLVGLVTRLIGREGGPIRPTEPPPQAERSDPEGEQ